MDMLFKFIILFIISIAVLILGRLLDRKNVDTGFALIMVGWIGIILFGTLTIIEFLIS